MNNTRDENFSDFSKVPSFQVFECLFNPTYYYLHHTSKICGLRQKKMYIEFFGRNHIVVTPWGEKSNFWNILPGDFKDTTPQSSITLRHVCGHVTRATWNLRVPVDSPWVVDSDRHWNFSNCSKNIGDIASLVEGYKSQNLENSFFLKLSFFLLIYWLYPSTKMIITPLFF